MQIFKSRIFKRILMPVCLLLLLVSAEAAASYFLAPVNNGAYFRYETDKYEKAGTDADIIFLGSSRVYHTFVPEIFEEELGMNLVLNAGSATQRPESSYYLLCDLCERMHPKVVVYGVQWNSILDESTDAQHLESALTACEKMSLSGKLRYMTRFILSPELPYFSNLYRYRDNFRFEQIEENLNKRDRLKQGEFTVNKEGVHYYHGKGFLFSNVHMQKGNIPIMDEDQDYFAEDIVSESKMRYLDKICDYCKKNDIKLILAATPISMMNMYHIGGFQDAVDFYTAYAKEKGVVFHNLNYLKDREEWFTDDMMTDYVHMSGDAAMTVSTKYTEILSKELKGEDCSSYFYSDLSEMQKDVKRVVALEAVISPIDDDNAHISIEALANEDVTVLYSVEAVFADGEKKLLADWTAGSEIDVLIPHEEGAKYLVKAHIDGMDDEPAWQEYGVK